MLHDFWGLIGPFLTHPLAIVAIALFVYWTGWGNGKAGRRFYRPTWPWKT
jgi:hypothetical protein